MNLFQSGNFVLNCGMTSMWKIDCDALTDTDIETLAKMISLMVGCFSSVEGVPQGGLRLAEALKKYVVVGYSHPHLIVDDVLTTGGSMERLYAIRRGQGSAGRPGIIGAVVFARGCCPNWVKALFQMPVTTVRIF